SFAIKFVRKNGDIALCIKPWFDRKNVELNTKKNGQWMKQQLITSSPFRRNVRFEVAVANEANGFQIFVNGSHFTTYEHRMCPYDISVVDIAQVLDLDV
ncbi:hypothetical protein PMAYCL1PPCAC_07854, partial [Pristionchus mayeri]